MKKAFVCLFSAGSSENVVLHFDSGCRQKFPYRGSAPWSPPFPQIPSPHFGQRTPPCSLPLPFDVIAFRKPEQAVKGTETAVPDDELASAHRASSSQINGIGFFHVFVRVINEGHEIPPIEALKLFVPDLPAFRNLVEHSSISAVYFTLMTELKNWSNFSGSENSLFGRNEVFFLHPQ